MGFLLGFGLQFSEAPVPAWASPVAYLLAGIIGVWWAYLHFRTGDVTVRRRKKFWPATAGILVVTGLLVWWTRPVGPAVAIAESYPRYHWKLTERLPASANNPMAIGGRTLAESFDERLNTTEGYRLTPLLYNQHATEILCEPSLWIGFSNLEDATQEVQVKTSKYWSPVIADDRLWYYANDKNNFECVVPAHGVGADESLFLTFPGAGKYDVEYRIGGIRRGRAVEIVGHFWLELRPTP
jgi:hypothetical protein